MFKNQDIGKKLIKQYLNKLEKMSNISQQEIDAFHTMIQSISEGKRVKLLERAGKIDKRLLLEQPQEQDEQQNNTNNQEGNTNQDDQNIFQNLPQDISIHADEPMKFDTQNTQCQRTFKTMQLNKGSLYNITSFQNTVLSLLIDGFVSELKTNNKRFYSPVFTNGNAGTLLVNICLNNVPKELQQYIQQDQINSNMIKQAIDTADKIRHGETIQKVDKPEYFDSYPIIVPQNFYQDVLNPPKSQPGQKIQSLFMTKEQFQENNYPEIQQQIQHNTKQIKLISLDCEMVQTGDTNHDLSLARLSVVDEQNKILLDEYSKPNKEIRDYLTQYSGITKQLIKNAQSEQQLQNKFKELVKQLNQENNLVICGHGLENDFKVLDFFYDQVIDTAILFSNGVFKQKLRFLTQKFIHENIQENHDGQQGHSSVEDAQAVMKLVLGVIKGINCQSIQISEDINEIKLWKQIKLQDRIEQCKNQAFYSFIVNTYTKEEFLSSKEKIQSCDKRQLSLLNYGECDNIQQTIDQLISIVPNRTIILFVIQFKDNKQIEMVDFKIKQ